MSERNKETKRVYMDYAATTPMHADVVQAMQPYFTESFGNPSSLYSYGQEAKGAIEEARGKVAALIGSKSEEVIFTSGGSEADNFAVNGTALARESKGNHIITSAIEHHAVLEVCKYLGKRGFEVTNLPVDSYGMVDPQEVRKAITDKTILISIMHANNEVGTVEPIEEIGKIARESGICFHTDAVQTTGHIPINVDELGVDLLSISAHKLYGPKGMGALYIRKGTKLLPLIRGGDQERRLRAGTQNVPSIVGFGKAAEIAWGEMPDEAKRLTQLRDRLIKGVLDRIDHTRLNGHPQRRLPNNVNIGVEFIEGESMLLALDFEGICVSTGSACTSSSLEPSHVLLAMGIPHERAHGSLRFSLGKWTRDEDIDRVIEVLPGIVDRYRRMSPLLKDKK